MKIFSTIMLIMLFSHRLSSVDCAREFQNYFSSSVGKEAAQEYLRLRADIAFNRAAHALFLNSGDDVGMKIDMAVIQAISRLDLRTQQDPNLLKAKESFEKYPLSRREFSKIFPFIKNILNENLDLQGEAKTLYALDDNDIKVFHMLGEIEGSDLAPKYLYQSANRERDSSVLNFPARINRLLENRKANVFQSQKLENHLKSLNRKVSVLIENLDISQECKTLCEKELGETGLFDFIKKFLGKRKFDSVKWGDVWMRVGPPIKGTPSTGIRKKKKVVETNNPMSIDPEQIARVYLEKLAKKVTDKYGYFFTKEQLTSDPDFLIAVAKAMDEDSLQFKYKGRFYGLPSIVETDSHQTAVELILENRGQIACSSWIGSSACLDIPELDWLNDNPGRRKAYEDIYDKEGSREMAVNYTEVGKQKLKVVRENSPSCAQGSNGKNDPSLERMLALAIIQNQRRNTKAVTGGVKTGSGDSLFHRTFVFNNKFCDGKTGKIIPSNKEGFLSYPGREVETPKANFYDSHTQKIHEAMQNGDEVFEHNGHLYYLSGAKYPKKDLSEDKGLNTKANLSIANNRKVFSHSGDVYQISRSGKKIAKVSDNLMDARISLYFSEKSLEPLSVEKLEQLRPHLYQAIENGQQSFFHEDVLYSTLTASPIDDDKPTTSQRRRAVADINSSSNDEELIKSYHKKFPKEGCRYYTIIDKKNSRLRVYKMNGEVVWEKEILTGKRKSDERIRWTDKKKMQTNNSTPAGIFTLGKKKTSGKYYIEHYEGNLIDLIPEDGAIPDGATNPLAIHQIPPYLQQRYRYLDNGNLSDNKASGGCVNMKKSEMVTYMSTYHRVGCPFYILPETDDLEFKVLGESLVIKPKNPSSFCEPISSNGCSDNFSITPTGAAKTRETPIAIDISYDGALFRDPLMSDVGTIDKRPLNNFISSIETNKNLIMKQKNLTNEEYDELAKIALGILGVESRFCLSDRYEWKETTGFQTAIGLYKTYLSNDGNEGGNSRGCTQIKQVERFLPPGVVMTGDDLVNPRASARATMYVLADLLSELKAKSGSSSFQTKVIFPGDIEGRKSNISDYLYYLYNGQTAQLQSGVATPEYSAKIRDLRNFMNYFSFESK